MCLSSTEIGTFFTPYSMVTYFFQWLTIFHQQDSGASVDIGCGNAFGGEDDGGADDNAEKVNNVIDEVIGFDLHEVPMGKKDLKEYLGNYCKALRLKLKDCFAQANPL